LFIEKVTFDSQVLAQFDVKKEENGNNTSKIVDEKVNKIGENQQLNSTSKNKSNYKQHSDSESDEEEEVFKNILSTKGKMASFLQQQNVSKNIIGIIYNLI